VIVILQSSAIAGLAIGLPDRSGFRPTVHIEHLSASETVWHLEIERECLSFGGQHSARQSRSISIVPLAWLIATATL